MRIFIAAFAAAALATAPAGAAEETYDEEMARLTRGMPADVADYIPRLIGCIHWGGEYGGDETPPERVKQINDAMAALKCDTIEADGKALSARYRNNAAIVQRLKDVRGNYGAE
jgi:hypothetical protein